MKGMRFPLLMRYAGCCIGSAMLLVMMQLPQAYAKGACDSGGATVNPAVAARSGIGGTGSAVSRSGVGGTGITAEGGIGGTGQVAGDGGTGGTGIVGTITGFASVCVNGVEVHYGVTTPVSVNGQSSTAGDLAVGQVVVIRADGTGAEVTARSISVMHAAVGPVSSINVAAGELRVLGQTVHARGQENLASIKPGEWVQVSGQRLASGDIAASRIEQPGRPLAQAYVNGYVSQVDARGFVAGGTRINLDRQPLPAGIVRGAEVSVSGRWDGAGLHARHIQVEPTRHGMGDAGHLVVEGYVHALHGKELHLGGRVVILDSHAKILNGDEGKLRPDQQVRISGRVGENQRVIADRIEIRHELPDNREERRGGGHDGKSENKSERNEKNDTRKESEGRSGREHSSGSDSRSSGSSDSSERGSEKRPEAEQKLPDSGFSGRESVDHSHRGSGSSDAFVSPGREQVERSDDFRIPDRSHDRGHHNDR